MRSGEKERLGVIRMITSAIKQRKESVEQFKAGSRQDLADKEAAEITLLQGYMPSQLSAAELDALINDAVTATGAASIKDMGRVMAALKERYAGKMDFAKAGGLVKSQLSS